MTASKKIDLELEYLYKLWDALGFWLEPSFGYRRIGDTILRLKNHEANYLYFMNDVEDFGIKKIVSVCYTGKSCRASGVMSADEFKAQYPEVDVVEITFDWTQTDVEDAIKTIKQHI